MRAGELSQRGSDRRRPGRAAPWLLLAAATVCGNVASAQPQADEPPLEAAGPPDASLREGDRIGADPIGGDAGPPTAASDGGVPASPLAADPPAIHPQPAAPERVSSGGQFTAIEPNPNVAPVIKGPSGEDDRAEPPPAGERSEVVIRTIVGLLVLLVLAYLGGHPRVLAWEERLGISQLITAGFPFVVLGMVARTPSVAILSDSVLAEMSPLLRIGLGWIGFMVGFRFDARLFPGLQRGTTRVVVLSTVLPFCCVLAASAIVLMLLLDGMGSLDFRDPIFIRDAIILGTAGAMTAHSAARLFSTTETVGIVSRIVRLEEVAGVIALALVAAFFRPQGPEVSWQLPGTGWFLVTIGLGATVGVLVYAILQRAAAGPDLLVLTVGSISFAAGAAGYLHLSSVVVTFVAGMLLANFPGSYHGAVRDILYRIERPIYLISLVIVGALWQVSEWRGWILMPVFMLARLVGKWLATSRALSAGGIELSMQERRALAISPLGSLAVAIVVNAQLLYPGGSISLIVSAVIGGGVLTEVFVQLSGRSQLRSRREGEIAEVGARAQEADP